MITLGIETSCDETAVAIVRDGVLCADLIASQDALHQPYGGIVPELASRRQMEVLPSLVTAALNAASLAMKDVDVIAVTRAPGLIGSLLVGLSFAKAVAFAHGKCLVGVNHLEGHLHAARLTYPDIPYPFIGLVVSGGHTSLYLVRGFGEYVLLGATRDDAAGEAFDKVAKLLGLGYPGGPLVDQLAADGNPHAFRFTRPKIDPGSAFEVGEFDFSFSGLKTAVAHVVRRQASRGTLGAQQRADLAASFRAAVVKALCCQLAKAAKKYQCRHLVVSGGVAANRELRHHLTELAHQGYYVYIPPPRYCTDNAAMIAVVGQERARRGVRHGMDLNAAAVEELGHITLSKRSPRD